jgi:hypothetical protein
VDFIDDLYLKESLTISEQCKNHHSLLHPVFHTRLVLDKKCVVFSLQGEGTNSVGVAAFHFWFINTILRGVVTWLISSCPWCRFCILPGINSTCRAAKLFHKTKMPTVGNNRH